MGNGRRKILFLAFAACWLVRPGPVAADDPEVAPSKIDLRVSPAIDMHFHVRTLIRKADDRIPAEFREAVAAAREIDEITKGGVLSWGAIESALYGCKTAKQIRESFSDFPEFRESRTSPSSEPVPVRGPALKLAEAYLGLESTFLRDHWPQRKRRLDARWADIQARFAPKSPECIRHLVEHLGMEDPQAEIPVYLVVEMPWPGAKTYRRYGGSALCVVSIAGSDFEGSLLYESILHEATHALDIEAGDEDVFDAVRDRLREAGIERRDDLYRDVPHTIMFVQAAETIRRVVDPEHRHYGDVSDYYERVSTPEAKVGKTVRGVWTRYLDGEITRRAATDELVEWTIRAAETR